MKNDNYLEMNWVDASLLIFHTDETLAMTCHKNFWIMELTPCLVHNFFGFGYYNTFVSI